MSVMMEYLDVLENNTQPARHASLKMPFRRSPFESATTGHYLTETWMATSSGAGYGSKSTPSTPYARSYSASTRQGTLPLRSCQLQRQQPEHRAGDAVHHAFCPG